MRNLKRRRLLNKIPFIILIIAVIVFFSIPSFIFAEGEDAAAIETTQITASETSGDESAGGGETVIEEPVEGSGETGTGQNWSEGDTQETAAETITAETGPMETDTTELSTSVDLTGSEVSDSESTIPVNAEADYSPSIRTDKDDYNPGETVIISGEGFIADGDIHIKIYDTDNIVENEAVIKADSEGKFVYNYTILGSPDYTVEARSIVRSQSGVVTFKDSAQAKYRGSLGLGNRVGGLWHGTINVDINTEGNILSLPEYTNIPTFCLDFNKRLDGNDTWNLTTDYANIPLGVLRIARYFAPTTNLEAQAMQEAVWTYMNTGFTGSVQRAIDIYNYAGIASNVPANIELSPESAQNYLPLGTSYEFIAKVTDESGSGLSGILVYFTTDFGSFNSSGSLVKTSAVTGANGEAKVTAYSTSAGAANIKAYVDYNGDQLQTTNSKFPVEVYGGLLLPINNPNNQRLIISNLREPVANASITWLAGGAINITKSGLEPGDSADFTVNGPQSNDFSFTLTPDNPTWSNSSLPWGSYIITETVPAGYNAPVFTVNGAVQAAGNTASVEIGNNTNQALTYTVGIVNTPIPGTITLHKTDAVNGADLAGSEWTLYKIEELPDVQTRAQNGALIKTTGANGLIEFLDLEWGTYVLKETKSPKGYLPKETMVTINAKNLNIELESEVADPRIPGSIKITKVDDGGSLIQGIGFTLYNSDKTVVIKSEKATDDAGKLSFNNLDWGTYTLSETDSLGYTAADDVKITISASNAEAGVKITVTNSLPDTPPEITVAGITEGPQGGIQVLAFTGQDPVAMMSGLAALIAGLAMVIATLSKRMTLKWKHAKR